MTEQLETKTEEFTQIPPTPVLPQYSPVVKRPLSVTMIAVLFFVGAAFEIFSLILPNDYSPTLQLISNLDCVVFALLKIAMGVGLLLIHPHARAGAITVIIVRFLTSIPLTLWEISEDLASNSNIVESGIVIPSEFIYITIAVIELFYALYLATLIFFLCRPAVKAAFARQC